MRDGKAGYSFTGKKDGVRSKLTAMISLESTPWKLFRVKIREEARFLLSSEYLCSGVDVVEACVLNLSWYGHTGYLRQSWWCPACWKQMGKG